jgi:hypothetical protein
MIVSALLNKHVPMLMTKGDSLSVGCNDPSLAWKLQPGSLREQLSETSALFLGAANGEPAVQFVRIGTDCQAAIPICSSSSGNTDSRMIQGLPTVLDKCKAEEFDPDTFIIWAGTSVAQKKAHVKAQMTRSCLRHPLADPNMYPSTPSSRIWRVWSTRYVRLIPTRM